jgi:ABC-type multidrug transport system ATPase subunit
VPEENGQSVLRYFREEAGLEEGEARGQLARFLFYGSDVFKDITNLSGGEWTRLRFAILMHRRPNLLILDEPTNHLDIDSREALEEALEEFPGTVLAVSHDRYFINRCFGKLWSIDQGHFSAFSGNYEYYKEKQAEKAAASGIAAAAGQAATVRTKTPAVAEPAVKPGTPTARKLRTAASWEQEIAAVEDQLGLIDAEMLDPQLASNAEKLAELQLMRDSAQQKLDQLYSSWLSETDR